MSSSDFYLNKSSKNYQSYRQLMIKTVNLLMQPSSSNQNQHQHQQLQSNETIQRIHTDIDDILEFETRLANISSMFEKTGGAAYQRMPVNKLAKLVPKINWQKYFELTIPQPLNDTESIGIFGFDYFLDVQDITQTVPER